MSSYTGPTWTNRLRVMVAIRELAGDDTTQFVNLWGVRDALGLDDAQMAEAVGYLEEKELIETVCIVTGHLTPMQGRIDYDAVAELERLGEERLRTPQRAAITDAGVSEVRRAERVPDEQTRYLPPYGSVTVNIAGNVVNSALQVASPGATQSAEIRVETVPVGGVRQIQTFFTQYYTGDYTLRLAREADSDDFAQFQAELQTLQAQSNSPRPKADTIRLSLASITRILKRAPGAETYATLIRAIEAIEL